MTSCHNVRKRRVPEDGTHVMVRSYGLGTSWIPGCGENAFTILDYCSNGLAYRDSDQLRKATTLQLITPVYDDDDWPLTPLQPNNDQIIQSPKQPIRRSQRERYVPDRLNL